MDFSRFWFANSGANPIPFPIGNSLRFRGSSYLSRSLSTTANYTMSVWVKFAKESNTDGIIGHRGGSNYKQVFKEGSGYDAIGSDNTGSTYAYSNNKCRDFSAWYHIVASHSSSASSKIYINGEEVSYRLQPGSSGGSTSSAPYYIGSLWNNVSIFNGYMAEVRAVESTELPTAFGEYNDDGAWVPIRYAGSYGSSGYYLDFSDPSNIGADRSGNGNNFTPSGFELANTSSKAYDFIDDSPTKNAVTVNPLVTGQPDNQTAGGLEWGSLRVGTNRGNNDYLYNATRPIPKEGKWYWEYVAGNVAAGSDWYFGVQELSGTPKNNYIANASPYFIGVNCNGVTYWRVRGSNPDSNSPAGGITLSSNDVVGVAVDMDTNLIRIYQNGVAVTGITGQLDLNYEYLPTHDQFQSSNEGYFNGGQQPFRHAPPSGYKALEYANFPDVPITNPSEHFNTVLYTGNSTTNGVNGVGFQPDLVWIKSRSDSSNNALYDSTRGVNKELRSDTQDNQWTFTDSLNSFTADGFSLGSDTGNGNVNLSGRTYVTWCWKKSVEAGFNIVQWTGNDVNGRAIAHGLGKAPEFIIVKAYSGGATAWPVWHGSLNAIDFMVLNGTAAKQTASSYFGGGAEERLPDATNFWVGSNNDVNGAPREYVAYVWTSVPGYSAFGSYVGNGDHDGPFVYTGFRPALVIVKNTSVQANWVLWDTVRNPYNVSTTRLFPNLPDAEATGTGPDDIDILSNGFKPRAVHQEVNRSGENFIYAAFAEHPFGGGNVAPSPAR